MPEGDTIFRAAATLQRALGAKVVTRFECAYAHIASFVDDTPIVGRTVERVEARGKHCLMRLSGELTLRTHMRMNGSWHIYRPGEAWQLHTSRQRVLVAVADFVAVGFDVPEVELLTVKDLDRAMGHLGPDFLSSEFNLDEAFARLRAQGDRTIGEALLDQRVASGVGNIWKNESCFVARVHPEKPVSSLEDATLRRLLDIARAQLQTSATTARPREPYVYGRGGKPCQRCRSKIQRFKQGEDARSTYFCPRCQPF